MRKELDEKLCADYPDIFVDRRADMRTTCMCWGFDCGDGWYELLNDLCKKLAALRRVTGVGVRASQVKEKYGTLRFYVWGESDSDRCKATGATQEDLAVIGVIVYDIIDRASSRSAYTCERCGGRGRVVARGWYACRCWECWKKEHPEGTRDQYNETDEEDGEE